MQINKQVLATLFIATAIGTERRYLIPTNEALSPDSPLKLSDETLNLFKTEGKSILGTSEPAELPIIGSPLEDALCNVTLGGMALASTLGFEMISPDPGEEIPTWNLNVEEFGKWLSQTEAPVEQAAAAEIAAEAAETMAEAVAEAVEESPAAAEAAENVQEFVNDQLGLSLPAEQAALVLQSLQKYGKRSEATVALTGIANKKLDEAVEALTQLKKALIATDAINAAPVDAQIQEILTQYGAALPASISEELKS